MKVSTKVSAAALAVAAIVTALPANADQVDRRQYNQDRRIDSGIRDGSLSRSEAAKLKAEQDRIAAMERAAERDGRVTRDERNALNRAQNQASRHIAHERHDGETRWNGFKRRWGWGYNRHSYNQHGHDHHGPAPRRWYRWW